MSIRHSNQNKFLHIWAERALVASDFHVPGESKHWVNKLIEYGIKHHIKCLIIDGDFWNLDSISRWEIKDKWPLAMEINHGQAILERLRKVFKIFMVRGNHDLRVTQALEGKLSYTEYMSTIAHKDIVVTNNDRIYLHSGNQRFRICHPSLYSKNKGTEVRTLSHNLQENILMGHQHFASVSTNHTGKYVAIDLGCMCNPNAFLYKNSQTSKLPEWENAFARIQQGKVSLITRYSIDQ